MIDPEFLAILLCPKCRSRLEDAGTALVCTAKSACGAVWAVEDGIPNFVEEATSAVAAKGADRGPTEPEKKA